MLRGIWTTRKMLMLSRSWAPRRQILRIQKVPNQLVSWFSQPVYYLDCWLSSKPCQSNGNSCLFCHLRAHLKSIHTGGKLLKCDICDYSWHWFHNMKVHKGAFHEVTKYLCDPCDYTSKWQNALSEHRRTKHIQKATPKSWFYVLRVDLKLNLTSHWVITRKYIRHVHM